jgi:hypothetical protein
MFSEKHLSWRRCARKLLSQSPALKEWGVSTEKRNTSAIMVGEKIALTLCKPRMGSGPIPDERYRLGDDSHVPAGELPARMI